ncbi:Protein ABHD18 [Lamellibrachia satsuma]|nr:Protein ABHD18 [Lamellibrachia satsuma]
MDGLRKPKQQLRSNLHNVSDLFVMGGALVLESLALLHWCEREGLGPLGLTGISMGGHMASLAATNWPKPIALIPCLSWSTASTAFTTGVMSAAIPWKLLQEQYRSDTTFEQEFLQRIHSPENERKSTAFMAGQEFARSYPSSLQDMQIHWDVSGNNEHSNNEHNTANSNESGHLKKSSNLDKTGHISKDKPGGSTDTAMKKGGQNEQVLPPHSNTNNSTKNKQWRNDMMSQLKHRLVELTGSHTEQREMAHNFMAGVMDEFTHLGNFSIPVDPSLIIIVVAKSDAYIPRESVISLKELWPEAQLRILDAGHISAFLFKQHTFRQAIIDSMKMLGDKYYS